MFSFKRLARSSPETPLVRHAPRPIDVKDKVKASSIVEDFVFDFEIQLLA